MGKVWRKLRLSIELCEDAVANFADIRRRDGRVNFNKNKMEEVMASLDSASGVLFAL